ncbi:MAG: dTDP-4-dehydrorhamnose 3,5-epimerase [Pseudomonadota bacterium]
MPLKITKTALPGVVIIKPDVLRDNRGFFMEVYHQKKYADTGLNRTFVQDNYSHSSKGILRGLHFQLKYPQGKLVYVVKGEIFDVAVDIRKGSPTFGRWIGEVLSEENNYQIFIPEGFAHGFCVISETADIIYKCTDFYHPDDDRGVLWSDEQIGITWPFRNPTVSDKDSRHPMLHTMPDDLLPACKN